MKIDRCTITDPPEYDTRMEADDLPESLGDDFEITAEERQRLTMAAQFGPTAIKRALAGDLLALNELKRLHVVRWEHERRDDGR